MSPLKTFKSVQSAVTANELFLQKAAAQTAAILSRWSLSEIEHNIDLSLRHSETGLTDACVEVIASLCCDRGGTMRARELARPAQMASPH